MMQIEERLRQWWKTSLLRLPLSFLRRLAERWGEFGKLSWPIVREAFHRTLEVRLTRLEHRRTGRPIVAASIPSLQVPGEKFLFELKFDEKPGVRE